MAKKSSDKSKKLRMMRAAKDNRVRNELKARMARAKGKYHVPPQRPLSGLFMVISMILLIASAIYTNSGKLSLTWGITFIIIFSIMFIASVVSITPPGLDEK